MQALRVSSAHPVAVPTEELTPQLLSPWKRQVSSTSSAESEVGRKRSYDVAGLKKLVFFGAAAGTGLRTQNHSEPLFMRASGRAKAQPFHGKDLMVPHFVLFAIPF